MKAKELEVLAEAVRTENHRKRALEAQKGCAVDDPVAMKLHLRRFNPRGLPSFATHDDKSQDFFEWNTEGIDWDRVAEKVSSCFPRTIMKRKGESVHRYHPSHPCLVLLAIVQSAGLVIDIRNSFIHHGYRQS